MIRLDSYPMTRSMRERWARYSWEQRIELIVNFDQAIRNPDMTSAYRSETGVGRDGNAEVHSFKYRDAFFVIRLLGPSLTIIYAGPEHVLVVKNYVGAF